MSTDLARTWGSTASERAARYACDEVLPDAEDAYFRAVDVHAPPEVVFRWLCQLRAAPYSYDLIDNFGRRSPRRLTPGLERLAVGQRVMTIFELVAFEPARDLTLRMRDARRLFGEVVVTYRVAARGPTHSRLVVKLLVTHPRAPLRHALQRLLLPWGDLVMMRRQLLTLKQLAERSVAGVA
jgi:hypothetical protein